MRQEVGSFEAGVTDGGDDGAVEARVSESEECIKRGAACRLGCAGIGEERGEVVARRDGFEVRVREQSAGSGGGGNDDGVVAGHQGFVGFRKGRPGRRDRRAQ